MNRITGPALIIALIALGCSASPTDDGDTMAAADVVVADQATTDTGTGDTASTDDLPVCLGGRPSSEIPDLRIPDDAWKNSCHSPWIDGTPVPVPAGGWLITSNPGPCGTDQDSTRLSWLKPDGTVSVLLEVTVGIMAQTETLPSLFAVMDSGFVLYRVSCNEWQCYDGVWPDNAPTLTARDWGNNILWTVSADDLGGANGAKLIDVDDDGLWVALTTVDEDRVSTSTIARIASADGGVSVYEIPVSGTLVSALVHDDGLLLLMAATTTIDDATSVRSLTAVSMGADGATGTPSVVFSKEYEPSGWFEIRLELTPLDTGILAGMVGKNVEWDEVLSYQDAFVNLDGSVRWHHDAGWPNRVAADVLHSHERADGSIEVINDDLSRYMVIDAGGLSVTASLMPADNPLGDERTWYFWDCYFLEDGLLILAGIRDDQYHYDAVAAMYEPGFTELRWARQYDTSCYDAPRLVRNDDGFILSCTHAVDRPEDASYDPMADQAGTYRFFDSICE